MATKRDRPPEPEAEGEGFWHDYWDRFKRQQVDDPVDERRGRRRSQ